MAGLLLGEGRRTCCPVAGSPFGMRPLGALTPHRLRPREGSVARGTPVAGLGGGAPHRRLEGVLADAPRELLELDLAAALWRKLERSQ